jgi:hypothetical protein
MQLLLNRDRKIQITEKIVKMAAGGNGKEIMQLLLDRNGEIQITKKNRQGGNGEKRKWQKNYAAVIKSRRENPDH